jgi:hypothetical protein
MTGRTDEEDSGTDTPPALRRRVIFFCAPGNCFLITVARFRGFRPGFWGGSGTVWGAIKVAFKLGAIRDWGWGMANFGFWILDFELQIAD